MGQISKEHALEILREAKKGDFLHEDLPTETDEILEMGEFYAQEAIKAYDEVPGMKRNKTVKAIMNIYKDGVEKMSSAQDAVDQIFGSEAKLFKGLPIPEDLPNSPPDLPTDFTSIGDVELRRLHGEFNAYLARAKWMLSVTINKLADATTLRDDAYQTAYLNAVQIYIDRGEKATAPILEATTKQDEEYKSYELEARRLQKEMTTYKALVDIYAGNVDRLSREWTMRTEETKRAY